MSKRAKTFEDARKRSRGLLHLLHLLQILPVLTALLAARLLLPQALAAEIWHLAPGPSSIEFTIGHLIFSEVDGRFGSFQGTVDFPGDDFTDARVDVSIDVASIYTGHADRDRELLGDEFFAAARFPEMRFASRSVVLTAPDTYRVIGDLTLRGITREVELEARSSGRFTTAGGERRDFLVTGSILRSDFGITWNDTWAGRLILDDRVHIRLDIALEPSG